MDLPTGSVEILITCGKLAATKNFNEQTTIEQVHTAVHQAFHFNLSNPYRIVYYDVTAMIFVDLENQLRQGINPFQRISTNGIQDTTSPPNNIQLFVVNGSLTDFTIHSLPSRKSHLIMHTTFSLNFRK